MKRQSKADKMDEMLAMKHGRESSKKQSMASRRHESMGAHEAHMHHMKHALMHLKALHKMAKGHSKKK